MPDRPSRLITAIAGAIACLLVAGCYRAGVKISNELTAHVDRAYEDGTPF